MKKILLTLFAFTIGITSFGQNQIEADAKSLIEAYVGPLGIGLGNALNNGWYNTAKPHKLGGFDVTFTINTVIVPENAKTFNITEANLETFYGGETPTILGKGDGSNVENSGSTIAASMPKGFNIPIIPLPMIQAGIGIIKGTEIDFRYMPDRKIGSNIKTGLFGLAVKHDLLQWVPIVDKIPIDLSVQIGYTKLKSEFELVDPTQTITPPKANLAVGGSTVNLILSKKLLMFTPHLSVGYNSTQTGFNINGKYNIAGGDVDLSELTDIEFESNSNLRTNIGFRFNIALIALQANYTLAEYPTATVGLGVSFR